MHTTLFEPLHPVQKAAFQKMSIDEKLALMHGLIGFARDLKSNHLKAVHPDWSEKQIHKEIARHFLHASS